MTLPNAIFATIIYHDIFDYPLTAGQIHQYLVEEKADFKKVEIALNNLVKDKKISRDKNLFFLKGRSKIVKIRKSRGVNAKIKFKKANFYSNLLKLIPTIRLVAVSGALSMENAAKNDDIDLVIVAAKNTLWITRLMANIALQPFRRHALAPHTKDKACLNLFLEETSLKIATQNLYTAHEIAQMKPLWQRQNAYSRFVSVNTWIKNYLPNWTPDFPAQTATSNKQQAKSYSGILSLSTYCEFMSNKLSYLLSLTEPLSKTIQLVYMRSKITTEKIGKYQLFFHPRNTEELVLKEYVKRLNTLNKRYSQKETSLQSLSSKT
jgi:hypothetical protein